MSKTVCLTDGKTWVDFWDEESKRWEPFSPKATEKLLRKIKRKRIALQWRSRRVAEFVLEREDLHAGQRENDL